VQIGEHRDRCGAACRGLQRRRDLAQLKASMKEPEAARDALRREQMRIDLEARDAPAFITATRAITEIFLARGVLKRA
jgi:hypothetical protein